MSRKGKRVLEAGNASAGEALPEEVLPAEEWMALQTALLAKPPKAVRWRPVAALGAAEPLPPPFATEPVPWFAGGHFAPETHQPGRFLQHAAGSFFVQDAGSLLALRLLDVQPHEQIADLCAAPGAKASGILEVVGPGGGFLLANEPIRGRLAALAWNLARVGFPRFAVSSYDVEALATELVEQFDGVLVDAPCTGQTLLGRGKQKSLVFSAAKISHAAARQRRILAAASQLVRPGGRLVYSTCTFAVEENEHVVAAFLSEHPQWCVRDIPDLSAWRSGLEPGGYRLFPHRDRCAGAYAVLLQRNNEAEDSGANSETGQSSEERNSTRPQCCEPFELAGETIGTLCDFQWTSAGQQMFGFASDSPASVQALFQRGLELAYQPGKQWMPSHALAMRRDPNWRPERTMELTDEDARQFLQGHPLAAGPAGWTVVTWRGHPLGWVRANALRANNGLPTAARLPFIPL